MFNLQFNPSKRHFYKLAQIAHFIKISRTKHITHLKSLHNSSKNIIKLMISIMAFHEIFNRNRNLDMGFEEHEATITEM